MATTLIITLCSLLLLAYVFDISARFTRIPSVIFLLITGWLVRQGTQLLKWEVPDLTPLLPVLGTVGLILIVLEGSLELEFNKSKIPLIRKSFLSSFFQLFVLAFLLAGLLTFFGEGSFKSSLTNAIPLCVISSAIAIPTVKSLSPYTREFVTYESSLSDILGVLFFNFVALNASFGFITFGSFVLQLLLITAISFGATVGLAFLLNRIDHHIKFAPIMLLVILIYAVSKVYHLPGLVFILLFGLFLGNLDELKGVKWIEKLHPENLNKEVYKFKDLIAEAAFLIRALFFLLFGYLIETHELLNSDTLLWAAGIVAAIFAIRAVQLRLAGLPASPLLYIAPRGLITILLFLSIDPAQQIALINKPLIIQVIILTALVMMFGLIRMGGNGKKSL